MSDARTAPSAARNRAPLTEALAPRLPGRGLVLEVASGTGEHALWFAEAFPHLLWQPTDRDPEALASIGAWQAAEPRPNLLPPLALDAADPGTWPAVAADVVLSINMVHIAPWAAALGLMQGAARVLAPGGRLMLYGPFHEGGVAIGPGNAAFDADLRARDPAWGVRDAGAVQAAAEAHGLRLTERVAMPADNRLLVFGREAG